MPDMESEPADGEPVCEACLQSAGMILVANADLFGVNPLSQDG